MTLSAALGSEAYLPTPGPILGVVAKTGRKLEDKYLRALTRSRPTYVAGQYGSTEQFGGRSRRRELLLSANFLELSLVAAGLAEAMRIVGITTEAELRAQVSRLFQQCAQITGLDPHAVLLRYQRSLHVEQQGRATDHLPSAEIVLEQMLHVARTVRAACPIRILEQWGHELNAADLSHRCRKAYDGLTAFVRRHSPEFDEQMRTLGRAYSEGRLTLDDVSRILQVSPSNAVALLEKYSFCRSLDVITLDAARRSQRLRAIAEEVRASPKEWSPPSEALLDRDVTASQRIEGVDAHPWLATSGG